MGAPPGSPPIARRRSYAACVRPAPRIASGCVWPANWYARCGCWTATSSPNGRRLEAALRVQGSALTRIPGVGVILAAKIVGRSGAVSRFPSRAHYASYTGTAPLEVSSGEVQRHRLSRGGDRQLNRALHIAALTQARMPGTEGHGYFRRKLAAGKSRNEALRCLKRRLSDVVYRCMVADARTCATEAA